MDTATTFAAPLCMACTSGMVKLNGARQRADARSGRATSHACTWHHNAE